MVSPVLTVSSPCPRTLSGAQHCYSGVFPGWATAGYLGSVRFSPTLDQVFSTACVSSVYIDHYSGVFGFNATAGYLGSMLQRGICCI